jgi:hypothetical protein
VTAQISTTGLAQNGRSTWVNWQEFVLLAGLASVAVWMRATLPMNADASWLITATEFLLDGKKLYVDIGETNPPASLWLYVPVVVLARLIGLKPEVVVNAYIFAIMLGALALANRIIVRAGFGKNYNRAVLLAVGLVLFAILPGDSFSEREHIAAMLFLPFIALTVARARGISVGIGLAVAAGLCGGCVVSIKPHFIAALELPVLLALCMRRSWRVLFSVENVVAGVIVVAYLASTFIFYPQFWQDVMPVNAIVYLPLAERGKAFSSICLPVLLALGVSSWIYCGRRFWTHPSAYCSAAAMGFFIAFVLQGKLWPYHIYPLVALGVLGAALAAFDRDLNATGGRQHEIGKVLGGHTWLRILLHPAAIALVTLPFFAYLFLLHLDRTALAQAITRIKPNPSIASLSGNIALGHPVTRMVEGRWAATQPALWIATNGMNLRQNYSLDQHSLEVLGQVERADLDVFLADLKRNRPDILLAFKMERELHAQIRRHPGMDEELSHYRLADTVALLGNSYVVDIYARQDAKPDPQ